MPKAEVVVSNARGMHTRCAARFAEKAALFSGTVRVACGANEVDGKSILSLLTLAAQQGCALEILVQDDGPDPELHLEALVTLVESGFGDV
jgi:phosphocarrier protein